MSYYHCVVPVPVPAPEVVTTASYVDVAAGATSVALADVSEIVSGDQLADYWWWNYD